MSFETAEEAFSAGNSFFVDEKYDAALRKYTDAIELDDKNASFFVARAAAHLQLKNEMDALDDSTRAIELDPTNEKAYLRKGMALFALGEYEMAKTLFVKGNNLNKSSAKFSNWLNKCDSELRAEMERDGQDEEREEPVPVPVITTPPQTVQPSVEQNDNSKRAEEAKTLGNQAFSKRKFKEAAQHYTQAIDLDGQNHIYWSNRSMAYLRLGENQKALEDADRVISINPVWPKGYFRRGSALFALARYEDAEESFSKGLSVAQEDDRAELENALRGAQQLVRLQSDEAFKKLQQKGGLPAKEVLELVQHNLLQLQGEEFGKAVTTVTVSVGNFSRCMRLIVINEDGKITRLAPPSPLVPSDKSTFEQLREGDASLVYAFVHVGKEGTPRAREQEYAFQEWTPRPEKTSSLSGGSPATTLTSQPLTNNQHAILALTTKEANVHKYHNPTITAKLFPK